MGRKIAALIAQGFMLAAIGMSAAYAGPQPLKLFQLFSDSRQTRPLADEPYRIWINGRFSEGRVTDETGAVITYQREQGMEQEFVAQIYGIGTYSFVIGADERQVIQRVGSWGMNEPWKRSCRRDGAACGGKGFYWIQLTGRDTNFNGEPYALTVDGTTSTGTVSEEGYIFILKDNPSSVSGSMHLRLCAGPTVELVIGINDRQSSATLLQDRQALDAPGPPVKACQASALPKYRQATPRLNRGMPYVFSEWSQGATPMQIAQQARQEEKSALDVYSSLAAANSDSFAWLGALPPVWSDVDYQSRWLAVIEKMKLDISRLTEDDVRKFRCRTPSQVGPVPDLDSVDRYLDGLPASASDPQLLAGLYTAAAKGNWLAVAQVYARESNRIPGSDGSNKYLQQYRTLQLMEWLQARKVGGLYLMLEAGLAASGYYSAGTENHVSAIEIYAALHDSYPSQHKLGKKWANADEAHLRSIGKEMLACARNALPVYRKLLGDG